MTDIRFHATRDSKDAWRDEDRAMAHVDIATTGTLEEARQLLVAYMEREIEWLLDNRRGYRSPSSLRRAADILEGVTEAKRLEPASDQPWSREAVECAGLVWAITRVEREVA